MSPYSTHGRRLCKLPAHLNKLRPRVETSLNWSKNVFVVICDCDQKIGDRQCSSDYGVSVHEGEKGAESGDP
jgi:hypothetical protein